MTNLEIVAYIRSLPEMSPRMRVEHGEELEQVHLDAACQRRGETQAYEIQSAGGLHALRHFDLPCDEIRESLLRRF